MYFTDISIDAVMMEKGISATAARVLYRINRYVNASRMKGIRDKRGIPYSFASHEAIAKKVGKSVRTVTRAIAELKKAGLIEVKRTRRYEHIYMCYYGVCGVSKTATNGASIYSNTKSINNIADKSILPSNTQAVNGQLSVDGLLNSATATAEEQHQQPHNSTSSTRTAPAAPADAREKAGDCHGDGQQPRNSGNATATIHTSSHGKTTMKRHEKQERTAAKNRQQRTAKDHKAAARQRYKDYIALRLGLNDSGWFAFPDERQRLSALADIIADAMSAGAQIMVNGCLLTAAQYWQVVQHIEYSESVQGLFDRINDAMTFRDIRKPRAYTLTAVYNAVQEDTLRRGTITEKEDLFRHMVKAV